jgi:hypothetical protein
MPFVLSLLVLAFSVVTLIDIITRQDWQVKHLPKFGWIILAIVIPIVGGIAWWAAGREYPERPARSPRSEPLRAPSIRIVDDRRMEGRSTEQQLADLEREIEADRLRAEIARRKAERGEA